MPVNFLPLLTRFIVGSFFPFGPLRMTCLVRDADLVAATFSEECRVSDEDVDGSVTCQHQIQLQFSHPLAFEGSGSRSARPG